MREEGKEDAGSMPSWEAREQKLGLYSRRNGSHRDVNQDSDVWNLSRSEISLDKAHETLSAPRLHFIKRERKKEYVWWRRGKVWGKGMPQRAQAAASLPC